MTSRSYQPHTGFTMRQSTKARALLIAANSLVFAALAGLASLYTQGSASPGIDGAQGQSMPASLASPFLSPVFLAFVAIGGTAAFTVAVYVLWDVSLVRAAPIIFGVTTALAALTGPLGTFGTLITFAVGVATMFWCRGQAKHDPAWSLHDTDDFADEKAGLPASPTARALSALLVAILGVASGLYATSPADGTTAILLGTLGLTCGSVLGPKVFAPLIELID